MHLQLLALVKKGLIVQLISIAYLLLGIQGLVECIWDGTLWIRTRHLNVEHLELLAIPDLLEVSDPLGSNLACLQQVLALL